VDHEQWHPGHRYKGGRRTPKVPYGLKIMSGDFTLNGGEPLMQHKFAIKLLTAAHEMGIHTAIETNGYFSDRLTDADLESIDLVLLGIKAWDPELHRRLTGMDNGPTHAFAKRLAALRKPVWVRFVLVPGLTDDAKDIAQIAAFTAELRNVERVEVLPFHQMGRYKWKELGIAYQLQDVEPPSVAAVERACQQFRSAGAAAY
jgi:pyruvate formate lyase activating enzyme